MLRTGTILVVALLAAIASAQHPPTVTVHRSTLLQLDGAFVESREAARRRSGEGVSMGFGKTVRWFAVDEARTVGGDPTPSGRDVLNALAPLQPNLLILGPPALREQLSAIPDGTRVRLEGLVDRGARTCLLREVKVAGDAPATP